MKAYGHSRKDKETCPFGCCTTKSGKDKSCRKVVDRSKRKTARQEGKENIKEEVEKINIY